MIYKSGGIMDLKNGVIPVTELKNHTREILARIMKTGDSMLVTQKKRKLA